MKKIIKKLAIIISCLVICITPLFLVGCVNKAETVTHNIKQDADNFNTYRKMTFVNLYTGQLLYSAEGYFSL